MTFDFGKIKAQKKEFGPVDPIELFQKNKSKITDGDINDLWLGQGDALRDWHEHRHENDVAIVLNTGAGKTLIGLLVAQSLVNETKGKVLYVCASIQLIEQTRAKAEGYGIKVTTYYSGNFNNDLFHKCEAACLTTYQALFNGKSIFKDQEIAAIIFDDAHAAESMIKNHFSLNLDRATNELLFASLVELFRPYYQNAGRIGSFNELLSGQNTKAELVPPFEILKNSGEVRRLLIEADIPNKTSTTFAWAYLKDHLDLCAFLISTGGIQMIPPVIPVSHLSYFQSGIRRVYLSATMMGDDSFIRTFGQQLNYVVKPNTSAGQCERLILFPEQVYGVEDDRVAAKEFIAERKSLVLVPSYYAAEQWHDIGHVPPKDSMIQDLEDFKRSTAADKLVLVARYDGIDLPGDTCRHLIIDGLPTGTGLLDKYLWESLRLSNTLRSTLACRIVQSLGRISRGMSDHGIVMIVGRECVQWLLTPRNQAYLPSFVQKQVKLGLQVSENCHSVDDMSSAANSCLNRAPDWVGAYEQFMDDCTTEEIEEADSILRDFAIAETRFIRKYWDRDFPVAAKVLERLLDNAFAHSAGLGAWYALWAGYCFELSNDHETAVTLYKRASGAIKPIPKYIGDNVNLAAHPVSSQAANIANEFTVNKGASVSLPNTLHADLQFLNGTGSPNQTEEALRCLGQYLGLDSTRPDKEHGTGPDVLWLCNDVALVTEAKTDKEAGYKKSDIGQLSDHLQWVDDHYRNVHKIPVFVGPLNSASQSANPSNDILVIELSEFKALSDKVMAAYEDIAERALPINLPQEVDVVLAERHLVWPDFLNQLTVSKLVDL